MLNSNCWISVGCIWMLDNKFDGLWFVNQLNHKDNTIKQTPLMKKQKKKTCESE